MLVNVRDSLNKVYVYTWWGLYICNIYIIYMYMYTYIFILHIYIYIYIYVQSYGYDYQQSVLKMYPSPAYIFL